MAISTIGTDALASAAVTSAKLASGAPSRSQLPAGTVLQVVSTAITASFTTSSTSYVDVTGVSASITPSSATSKILVSISGGCFGLYVNASYLSYYNIVRGSTQIAETIGSQREVGNQTSPASLNYLDSPNTTLSTTYKVQAKVSSANTVYVINTTDVMTITLMEIAA